MSWQVFGTTTDEYVEVYNEGGVTHGMLRIVSVKNVGLDKLTVRVQGVNAFGDPIDPDESIVNPGAVKVFSSFGLSGANAVPWMTMRLEIKSFAISMPTDYQTHITDG